MQREGGVISTVTTSTVTTITSATAVTGLAGGFALVAVLAFLVLLIGKEMASSTSQGRLALLARGLNIGLLPLGLAFGMIAIAQLAQVLR